MVKYLTYHIHDSGLDKTTHVTSRCPWDIVVRNRAQFFHYTLFTRLPRVSEARAAECAECMMPIDCRCTMISRTDGIEDGSDMHTVLHHALTSVVAALAPDTLRCLDQGRVSNSTLSTYSIHVGIGKHGGGASAPWTASRGKGTKGRLPAVSDVVDGGDKSNAHSRQASQIQYHAMQCTTIPAPHQLDFNIALQWSSPILHVIAQASHLHPPVEGSLNWTPSKTTAGRAAIKTLWRITIVSLHM